MSLIAELKRRKVFKVGAAYLVVAWLAVQAMSIGFPTFDAPPWALRIFILIALLGFPIAVVMAWVFDVTPEGVKFDAKPDKVPLWALLGLLHFGQNERALQVILQGPSSDDAGLFIFLWNPQSSAARRLPAFAQFARKVGFADLWDKYGAPDQCKKNSAGDYVCE